MRRQKRTLQFSLPRFGLALALACSAGLWSAPYALAADPFAANNGLYPSSYPFEPQWKGPYRVSNYDYPDHAESEWLKHAPREKMTIANAYQYVDMLKTFLEPSLEAMIDSPDSWDPMATKWYSMPWTAEISGTDATSGREAILGSFSGQVIQGSSFDKSNMTAQEVQTRIDNLPYSDLTADMQNHTIVYYDPVSATMLKKIWANPFSPLANEATFPEGSIVIKAGAVTATPAEWPVVTNSAVWTVFRPPFHSVTSLKAPSTTPELTELRVLQFDAIVKDTVASPETGWVFITWVYDRDAPGARPWDRLVPLGAMWGNDPEFARNPSGTDPAGRPLQETWINPKAPRYAHKTLGWGGRLSGPIDVSLRHGIVFTDGSTPQPGVRASSCLSCHGTSQYPFVANLYPSPNKIFPQDGKAFLLFPPGSAQWAEWFANRPGNVAQNKAWNEHDSVGLDYDMLLTFSLSNFNNAIGKPAYVQPNFRVH